ncbi:hypothetical protein J056_003531 [Wallemia ichthyophaga EXF-994]|uniref:Uncharacterized protein n=1 Tax=Wallemia ichthyophaga (strain EXF-994 / CBS 113033) TaxID=1299270 RepID=R9AL60_WALI9|nr:uncharacterized protein J056_003531 [Wallemia ichthyophaga EXF-994]EOR02969.1 hypothetical protein J056_003531 [Wallemia ichthyophaga EXF-994]TIB29248.1 hypothetical protein E3P84_03786 [Wallemia ichthyophaga]
MTLDTTTPVFNEFIARQSVTTLSSINLQSSSVLLLPSAGGVPNPATLDLFKAWKKVIPSYALDAADKICARQEKIGELETDQVEE